MKKIRKSKAMKSKLRKNQIELLAHEASYPETLHCYDRCLGMFIVLFQIQSFKPEAFWTLDVTCDNRRVKWSRVRSFDREVILSFFNEIKNEKEAYVVSEEVSDNS